MQKLGIAEQITDLNGNLSGWCIKSVGISKSEW
jgi:hypothetical protein